MTGESSVTAGLAAYNKEHIGRVDHQALDILMRSDSGEIDQPVYGTGSRHGR